MFPSSFREARSSSLSFSQGNALWFTLGKSSELLRRLVDHRGTVADHATPVSSAAGVASRRSSIQDRITKRLGSPYDSPLSTETAERSSRKSLARLHFGYVLDRALVSKGQGKQVVAPSLLVPGPGPGTLEMLRAISLGVQSSF